MTTLTELTLYPIKSCAGIALQEATLTSSGLASSSVQDREFMVVDAQGQFVTQRTHPKMATIAPAIKSGMMVLNAPDLPSLSVSLERPDQKSSLRGVRVWRDDLQAHDCGDQAANWLSQVVEPGCRLVRFHPDTKRIPNPKWTHGAEATNMFSDSFPFMLLAQASLDDLNEKLHTAGRSAVPMNRFRPNIVIDGIDAYAEDSAHALQIGDVLLQIVRPCTRCPIPSIDQATGIFGPDPLDILKTYHTSAMLNNAVTFGMHAILIKGAGSVLRVGQAARLLYDA